MGIVCLGLLPICTDAKDPPAAFRVTSIGFKEGARLDSAILQACDVARTVTDAIELERTPHSGNHSAGNSSVPATTELVLRIDRVVKFGGQPPPGPKVGGTELGISLISAGAKEMHQPFLCRADGLSATNASHCARIAHCSEKIAGQISTWLSWQTR